jgi:hypothetical protein
MISVKDYEEVKRKHEALKSKKNKAEGAMEETLKRLKDDFGFDNIEDAEKHLKAEQKKLEALNEDLEASIEEFSKEWEKFENE